MSPRAAPGVRARRGSQLLRHRDRREHHRQRRASAPGEVPNPVVAASAAIAAAGRRGSISHRGRCAEGADGLVSGASRRRLAGRGLTRTHDRRIMRSSAACSPVSMDVRRS
ncbi:hypothetical protein Francci3_3387 [Frankia casuarinae]|uniref:Uncharacterized protein n=1 Tax=Frankia casuarinae (strain DSM 45818 / CECT 9043 / HFP020203 / CcI3) TaxID=106370 RepID=Q2J7K1_FRACC|nr:hypothetical protein Francci3_3387 [Frankia casuarinae]